MAKKSFKNSARESVASAFFGEATEDTQNTENTGNTKDTQNTKNIKNTQDTKGAKKEKLPPYRINLKLKGEYKDYLSDAAWENRTSITQYLNDLIEKDMKEKEENK